MLHFVLAWLLEQRSTVAGCSGCARFAITLILRYVYELWWPFGILLATGCAVVAIVTAGGES